MKEELEDDDFSGAKDLYAATYRAVTTEPEAVAAEPEEEEVRGRSIDRKASGSRRRSADASLQRVARGIEGYQKAIDAHHEIVKDEDNTLLKRIGSALTSYAVLQMQGDAGLSYQASRFTKYASDAVSDVVKGESLHPDTKYGLVTSAPTVALNLAPSLMLGGIRTKVSSAAKPRSSKPSGGNVSAASSSAASSSTTFIKPSDVAASYVSRGANDYMCLISGKKGAATANQNRQSSRIETRVAVNSNTLRMRKTGTGDGSDIATSSNFVDVPVASSTSVTVGGGRGPTSKPANSAKKTQPRGSDQASSSQGSEAWSSSAAEASSVNASVNLKKKLSELQKMQETHDVKKVLPDGRIRYYSKESLAKTQGPTRGRRHVIEHNLKTGQIRSWEECYTHGNVLNRVHPKNLDG